MAVLIQAHLTLTPHQIITVLLLLITPPTHRGVQCLEAVQSQFLRVSVHKGIIGCSIMVVGVCQTEVLTRQQVPQVILAQMTVALMATIKIVAVLVYQILIQVPRVIVAIIPTGMVVAAHLLLPLLEPVVGVAALVIIGMVLAAHLIILVVEVVAAGITGTVIVARLTTLVPTVHQLYLREAVLLVITGLVVVVNPHLLLEVVAVGFIGTEVVAFLILRHQQPLLEVVHLDIIG